MGITPGVTAPAGTVLDEANAFRYGNTVYQSGATVTFAPGSTLTMGTTQVAAPSGNAAQYLNGAGQYTTPSGGGGSATLTFTTVQLGSYSANPGDFAVFNTTALASAVLQLPTAPANGSIIGGKIVILGGGAGNGVAVTCGAGDAFDHTGGVTTITLLLYNQGLICQYSAAARLWYVTSDDIPLSQLDGRYLAIAGNAVSATTATTAGSATTAGNFTGNLAGDVTGTQGAAVVGKIQGVAITAAQANLVADLNNATARSATATLLPGEETIFTGSTAAQTLTLPATPPGSSLNTVTNTASVSLALAAGAGATISNFGTVGSLTIPAGYMFSLVYIGTTWYVQSAGPSDFAKGGALSIAAGGTGDSAAPVIGQIPVAISATTTAWYSGFNNGPWIFDVRAYGALGNGKIVNDGSISSSSNPTTLTCATSTPFTVGDVGKAIIVKGAGATGLTSLVTTIAAYVSAGVVTLTTGASTTISAAVVMWATDDTAAIQAAINAAVTYAKANAYYAKVFIPPAGTSGTTGGQFYGIAGALVTGGSSLGNAQLTLPVVSGTGPKLTLEIEGTGNAAGVRYSNQLTPIVNGSCLVSMLTPFASLSAQNTSVTNNGNPALLGGPTGKNGYGVLVSSVYQTSNLMISVKNVSFLTTHSANGWTLGAMHFGGCANANLENVSYGTAGTVALAGGGVNDYASVSAFGGGVSIGLFMPGNGNNDSCQLNNVVCQGGYTYACYATEHTLWRGGCILYCWAGLCPVAIYNDGGTGVNAGAAGLHAVNFPLLSIEACLYHLHIVGTGTNIPALFGVIDSEGTVDINDTTSGAGLAATRGRIEWNASAAIITTFGTGLSLYLTQNAPGPVTTPTYALNTAQINAFWRWATVIVAVGTGTGITSIQVSALAGGASAPAMTTVYSQGAAAAANEFTFRVGPGAWWAINATAGTEPTLNWILD